MVAEAEFVTPPSTPAVSPPEPQLDGLEIVVEEQRRIRGGGSAGEGGNDSKPSMTIFRVPANVRAANRELYEPRLVSVGPYYRGREALRAMEQHKWRFLNELLLLAPERFSLSDCVRAVRRVEQEARRCYSERTPGIFDFDSHSTAAAADGEGERSSVAAAEDEFAKMLLLDGCFILRLLIKSYRDERDELCDVGWGRGLLTSDLLLLENQIPFSVLQSLFSVVAPQAASSDLFVLILSFLRFPPPREERPPARDYTVALASKLNDGHDIHHLLHLLYEATVPTATAEDTLSSASASPQQSPSHSHRAAEMGVRLKLAVSKRSAFLRDMAWMPQWMKKLSLSLSLSVIRLRKATACFSRKCSADPDAAAAAARPVVPSVTLLLEAGVAFEERPASPPHHPWYKLGVISFDTTRGVLAMPRLVVDSALKPVLVNMVAFEQTMDMDGGDAKAKPMSSYVALLGCLVRARNDVDHLHKRGIVENLLSSDDFENEATNFFQHLGDCSSLDYDGRHFFAGVFKDLNQYYRSSWRRHKTRFLRNHCSSPWSVVALAVAVFAFCFVVIQFFMLLYNLAKRSLHPI